jgi:hypothetical protein
LTTPPIVLHMNEAAHVLELLKTPGDQNIELESIVRAQMHMWTMRNRPSVLSFARHAGAHCGDVDTERVHGDSEDRGTLVIVVRLYEIDRIIFPNIWMIAPDSRNPDGSEARLCSSASGP